MDICNFMIPQKCSKIDILIIFKLVWAFGHGKTSGDMVGRCMPNSGRGGCSGNRVMTIFVSYVGLHFPNIGYFKVYGSI